MAKFKQKKKHFIWHDKDYKFVWSNIEGVPHSSMRKMESDESFMYIYYTFTIYKKKKKKWKKLCMTYGHDFPALENFLSMMTYMLNNSDLNLFQQNEIAAGNETYYSFIRTEMTDCGLPVEDTYSITQCGIFLEDSNDFKDANWENEKFYVYFGCGCLRVMGDIGITLVLDREELNVLRDGVSSIFEFARDEYNHRMDKYFKFHSTNKEIIEHKLYVKNKHNDYEDILKKGDKGSLYAVENMPGECNSNISFCSIDGVSAEIIDIDGNSVKMYIEHNDGSSFDKSFAPCEIIDFLRDNPDKRILSMTRDEIMEDFIGKYVSDYDIKNFSSLSYDAIYDMYSDAIVNIYYMCVEQHPYMAGNDDYRWEGYRQAGLIIRKIRARIRGVRMFFRKVRSTFHSIAH